MATETSAARSQPLRSLSDVLDAARSMVAARLVVAAPEHERTLAAVAAAVDVGLVEPVLVGGESRIHAAADAAQVDLTGWTLVPVASDEEAAGVAAGLASTGGGEILMKGQVQTATLLRAVLQSQVGLRRSRLLTHVGVYELSSPPRLLLLSDGGVVISPSLEEKVEIVRNAVDVARALGISSPRVALLAALEHVSPGIRSTTDAANIAKMGDRHQILHAIIDGPLALDTAVSTEQAGARDFISPVGGTADVVIVPHIEAGNVLAKALTYFSGCRAAGIVSGPAAPVILTSRSAAQDTKLVSIALAMLVSRHVRATSE